MTKGRADQVHEGHKQHPGLALQAPTADVLGRSVSLDVSGCSAKWG